MRTSILFSGGSNKARNIQINLQQTVNWYPSINTRGAKGELALYPTPGLRFVADTPSVGRSNGVDFGGELYFVCNKSLIKIDANGSSTTITATITSGINRIEMAAGRDYLMLVDGSSGWTYDGTTFSVISHEYFPAAPTHVRYLDGYFIVNDTDTDEVSISGLEDPTAWDGLDFTSAEANPDDVLAIGTTHRDLYLVGSKTTEVYFNSGNADFPFEIYPGGVLDWGIIAAYSLALAGDVQFMLARRGESGGVFAVRITGFTVEPISNNDLAYEWQQYTTVSDAFGFAYSMGDETFYTLTFPSADKTFVYNSRSGLWHEQKSSGVGRWAVAGHGYLSNKHYAVSSGGTGKVYLLDPGYYQEGSDTITRTRISQVFHSDRRRIEVNELELEFETGTALLSGQGSDPQAMLRYSRDGGKTWSYEIWRDIGARGEYEDRVIFRNLGMARQFVFELVVAEPIKAVLANAYIDYQLHDA